MRTTRRVPGASSRSVGRRASSLEDLAALRCLQRPRAEQLLRRRSLYPRRERRDVGAGRPMASVTAAPTRCPRRPRWQRGAYEEASRRTSAFAVEHLDRADACRCAARPRNDGWGWDDDFLPSAMAEPLQYANRESRSQRIPHRVYTMMTRGRLSSCSLHTLRRDRFDSGATVMACPMQR
jgi:hypothetical protein